ncbi:MAG TPA: hypothetical protein VGD65_13210 [Chryseosolibacter sp.]
MKKIFYILLIAFSTSVTITACTEEQVEPQNTTYPNSGGGTSENGG